MFNFRLLTADEPLEPCLRLRYDVYCLELEFLPASDCPEGLETDEYDRHSLHFVCERNDQIVGYVRMVRSQDGEKLPIEEHFRLPKLAVDRTRCCEISRLIVDKKYRNSTAELGLLRELYRAGLQIGIECSFAAMESKLKRQLNGFGFPFTQIGDEQWYMGGDIIPCLMYTAEIAEYSRVVNPGIHRFLTE